MEKQSVPQRWTATETKQENCVVTECKNKVISKTHMATIEKAVEILGQLTDSVQGLPLGLCNLHYQILYKAMHDPIPCAACGALPKCFTHR